MLSNPDVANEPFTQLCLKTQNIPGADETSQSHHARNAEHTTDQQRIESLNPILVYSVAKGCKFVSVQQVEVSTNTSPFVFFAILQATMSTNATVTVSGRSSAFCFLLARPCSNFRG